MDPKNEYFFDKTHRTQSPIFVQKMSIFWTDLENLC